MWNIKATVPDDNIRHALCISKTLSTPVRRRIKESRWVLKKIIPGVIKTTPSGFGIDYRVPGIGNFYRNVHIDMFYPHVQNI